MVSQCCVLCTLARPACSRSLGSTDRGRCDQFQLPGRLLRTSIIYPTPLCDKYGLAVTAFAAQRVDISTQTGSEIHQSIILKQFLRSKFKITSLVTEIYSTTRVHSNTYSYQITSIIYQQFFLQFFAGTHKNAHNCATPCINNMCFLSLRQSAPVIVYSEHCESCSLHYNFTALYIVQTSCLYLCRVCADGTSGTPTAVRQSVLCRILNNI